MAQSNLLRLGIGLGVLGLLLVGSAYLAFTDAFETYEDTEWESADDTKSTWRIGDGTASFYNYIYYIIKLQLWVS